VPCWVALGATMVPKGAKMVARSATMVPPGHLGVFPGGPHETVQNGSETVWTRARPFGTKSASPVPPKGTQTTSNYLC